jgi:hypothetical protein
MPARPGPGKAATHWTPILVPCRSGFGTANHIVSAQLFLHLPEPASGDHHFTLPGDGRGALPSRQNCTGPESSWSKDSRAAKNAGWQLLSNLGLFIIVILRTGLCQQIARCA